MLKKISFSLTIFVMMVLLSHDTSAAPGFEQMVMNEQTKECALYFPGDEFSSCALPEGWNVLGGGMSCPDDFNLIELEVECEPTEWAREMQELSNETALDNQPEQLQDLSVETVGDSNDDSIIPQQNITPADSSNATMIIVTFLLGIGVIIGTYLIRKK